ncbi:hypothetical protein NQ176_g10130 [Zarea fungicola]|uniref:Uncharacterized protein n=1 Tax=Zarea fungicola TaxID=93591 RepID=A0ACC1MJG8_9HYPO|nr:hypothetical protein NQ176_g10130 [Lecanicillium fungicola]
MRRAEAERLSALEFTHRVAGPAGRPSTRSFQIGEAGFKFFNPDDDRDYWYDIVEGPNARRQFELHTDPFYAECRAYGRINEARKSGKVKQAISMPCFGFLFIDEKYLPILLESGVDLEEDCLLHEDCISTASESATPPPPRTRDPSKAPIRSIVKELASHSSGVNYRSIERIRQDILALNRLQVYNRDVRMDNILDGKLVDFGSAWTEPHCCMSPLNFREADHAKVGDLAMLEEIADDEGYLVSWRRFKNLEYKKKLRPKKVKK